MKVFKSSFLAATSALAAALSGVAVPSASMSVVMPLAVAGALASPLAHAHRSVCGAEVVDKDGNRHVRMAVFDPDDGEMTTPGSFCYNRKEQAVQFLKDKYGKGRNIDSFMLRDCSKVQQFLGYLWNPCNLLNDYETSAPFEPNPRTVAHPAATFDAKK